MDLDIYLGNDLAQVILAIVILAVFVAFVVWGLRTVQKRSRTKAEEAGIRYADMEIEGMEEEEPQDLDSEAALMEADERAAEEGDIIEHKP